ncbi:MAG: isochorismate synthase, partial [Thermoleophilaceae bacterium]
MAAVTVELPAEADLSAAILAARRPSDRYFCLEQPERGGFALAALGEAAVVRARGPDRFEEAARSCAAIGRRVLGDDPAGDPGRPPAAGPVFVGGFAFAPQGGAAPEWSSLDPAQLTLPEVALARYQGRARLTACVAADGDETPDELVERAEARLDELAPVAMPLLDPDPLERARVAGASPPEHYEEAVARATARIRAGELRKVVLAREVRVHSSR